MIKKKEGHTEFESNALQTHRKQTLKKQQSRRSMSYFTAVNTVGGRPDQSKGEKRE